MISVKSQAQTLFSHYKAEQSKGPNRPASGGFYKAIVSKNKSTCTATPQQPSLIGPPQQPSVLGTPQQPSLLGRLFNFTGLNYHKKIQT